MASICILGPAYPLKGGGMATFNERLARAFMNMGHRVKMVTFSLQYPTLLFPGKTQLSSELPPDDLDISVRVNSINPVNWHSVGREIRHMAPDLLVIRYWLPFMAPCLGTIAAIVKKNNHTRVVAITDNIVPHEKRPGDRCLTKYFLNRVHSFVCMSGKVRNDLIRFGVSTKRIRQCMHPLYDHFGVAVDKETARKKLGIKKDGWLVLFFGFIREYKGLDILLKALAHPRLEHLPLSLLVAGEFYTNEEKYHRMARSMGVYDRVIWHSDFIPSEKVRFYFSAADLVVQPYKSATQSGVTQIAYHFEKPMVVTNVGGLPEMVIHGRGGLVVDASAEAIGNAMADFFTQDDMGRSMQNTLKQEKKRFSWERLVNSLLDSSDNI